MTPSNNGSNEQIAEIWKVLAETKQIIKESATKREQLELEIAREKQKREEQYAREKQEREEQYAREKQEREEQYAREKQEREQMIATAKAEREAEKAELDRQVKRTNREVARVSKMFGEGVEDWVASDIDRILSILFGCDEDSVEVNMRVKRRRYNLPPGERNRMEIDVIANCETHVVFVEAKNTLRPEDIPDFVNKLQAARAFFPEYDGYTLVGAVASLQIEDSLVTHATRQGLLVFTLSNGLVKVVNRPDFVPQTY